MNSFYRVQRRDPGKGSALHAVAGLWLVPLPFLLLSCAGQVAPTGGPPDRTPPAIVRTLPDSNAVRVTTSEIVLEFDKYVDRRSVEESIFLSPNLGDLEFDWSGREVTITFSASLRPKTTYVVNVGTDVVDVRERNRMASGFTLAFSTGDSIDRGSVAGQVFDAKPEGVMIFAYQLDHIKQDTLNPARAKPDFIMQTGQQGKFRLSHLPLGIFRLFAVRDEHHDLIYNPEVDEIGMASGDFMLSPKESDVEGIPFRLMKEDTTRPFVTSAVAPHRQEVDVRLSEPLDSTRIGDVTASVVDTAKGGTVPVLGVFWKQTQPPTLGVLLVGVLDSPAVYRVRLLGGRDRAGNPLDAGNAAAVFEGASRADTGFVRLSIAGVRDSSKGIRPDGMMQIDFSQPVRLGPLEAGIVLRDSIGRAIQHQREWEGGARLYLHFVPPLQSFAWYSLQVRLDSVVDPWGKRGPDSLFRCRFQTLDLKTTGEVSGTLVDSLGGRGGYFIIAESVDLPQKQTRSVHLEKAGPFTIGKVIEGKYTISGFQDADGNGRYSYGTPFPFTGSERFGVVADTVRVRARWAMEGVLLRVR